MRKTRLVGIINLTPDSLSDGSRFADGNAALDAMTRMIGEGASVIDIGAESTRPGAVPISPQEEWRRLEPVLKSLYRVRMPNVSFSLDTRHAETARKAVECGIDWINDVTGFSAQAMADVAASCRCRLVMMHSLGAPASPSITLPPSADVVNTLFQWATERAAWLERQGIGKDRIIFDPGIGFGKTAEQSLAILRRIDEFSSLGLPLLVGHSRKSFLAGLHADRDDGTLAVSLYLAAKGVDYLRIHDVARHAHLLNLWNRLTDDDQPYAHRRTA